ncbi:hypothetical protein [Flagellimonas onchidii]|uniref:hypothetical protein n=1 Tax=Flagellimonas onchidii TaxID=2562684 RepID=UPI0010A639F6|nr:hypothetical protein [Allomuricauda onchidii]
MKNLSLIAFLLWSICSFSQSSSDTTSVFNTPEKIYLQLDSNEYISNQTIWFKAIVTDSRDHTPSTLSGVLYVDLINDDNQIIEHKLVKLNVGLGHGNIDLQNGYQGRFLIRAYTQWNQNFGDDFIFQEYITVHGLEERDKNLFEELVIVQNEEGEKVLSGNLNFDDENHEGSDKLNAYLDWGADGKEVIAEKNGITTYFLKSEIPKKSSWVKVSLADQNGLNHSKTFVIEDTSLDVQFFPESGKMIQALQNKIGFKAMGFDGRGRKIQGTVYNSRGKVITDFQSNALGMGFFHLTPSRDETYYAKVRPIEEEKTKVKTYSLPKVHNHGTLLSVYKVKDKVRFRIASNQQKDGITINASCRGTDYYRIEGLLQNGRLTSEIPAEDLPDGIVVFTLMDEQDRSIAERLFYNESGKEQLEIKLETVKTSYSKREKTSLDIQVLKPRKDTIMASLSTKVVHKNQWRRGVDGDIRSYFLLESEIRGNIENPGRYFDKSNPDRLKDIDVLLLTQGWRNYKHPSERRDDIFYWPQEGLVIRGKAIHNSFKHKKENIDLTLAMFGKETSIYSATSDSLGNFKFLLDDTYGKNMRVMLHANSDRAKKKPKISLNACPKPKTKFKSDPFAYKVDTITKALLKNEQNRKRMEIVLDSLYGVTQLEEVIVEDYKLTPKRKKIYDKYGMPDVLISGDSLLKKEKKWSYGLYSILMFNYGSEVQIEQFPDGFMLAHVAGGPTLLMVDGRLIQKEEYTYVPHMPPAIVESLEIIKFAKRFKHSYFEIFPETPIMELPSTGHIISVNTKGNVGLYARDKPTPGTLNTMLEVFSPIKEFYVPKYDKPIPADEQKPDLRSLVHWDPLLYANDNGKASTSFYNGDIPGEYVIVVEAISNLGHLGYAETTFYVEE